MTSHPDLLVIGAGPAGLVAARRAALAGARVLVLEATARPGGMIERAELSGIGIDIGAEAFATRGGAVEALIAQLGLGGELVEPRALGSWGHADGESFPMPRSSVLGIPADPGAAEVRAALGPAGAARAAEDARLDPRLGEDARNLDALVRARMGDAVADRLVTPVARGVYSLEPAELDHRVLVPGLLERLRERGGLAAAVAELRAGGSPGAAVRGLRGGMHGLIAALAAELERLGVELRLGASVAGLERARGAGWRAVLDGGERATAASVLACAPVDLGPDASTLVAAEVPSVPAETVAILVASDELDPAPRGTGVLVGEPAGEVRAKALTHVTAKWPWAAAAAGAGRHILRLSYPPGADGRPRTADLDDGALAERARVDASLLLGTTLAPGAVRGIARRTWRMPAPPAQLGRAAQLEALRRRLAGLPGVEAAGTWIDGTGLASVIPAAERAVDRLAAGS